MLKTIKLLLFILVISKDPLVISKKSYNLFNKGNAREGKMGWLYIVSFLLFYTLDYIEKKQRKLENDFIPPLSTKLLHKPRGVLALSRTIQSSTLDLSPTSGTRRSSQPRTLPSVRVVEDLSSTLAPYKFRCEKTTLQPWICPLKSRC